MPNPEDFGGLPRIARRVPKLPDAEIFPEKQCFCCDNRGIVAHRWIKILTPDYQEGDIPQICQRPGCKGIYTGDGYYHFGDNVRFAVAWDVSPELCDYLHNLGYCQWQEDREAWHQQLKADPDLPKKNYQRIRQMLGPLVEGGRSQPQEVKSAQERALEEVGL